MTDIAEPGIAGDIGGRRVTAVTAPALARMKAAGERIVFVTAYDYPSALACEAAGVDAILVGDSVALVLGYDNTIPVTLDDMVHHTRAASRAVRRSLLVADLPFGSYQAGPEDAIRSAVRLMKEGGAHAVKLEGGSAVTAAVRGMTAAGIPVMGHLGLTPQSVYLFGGHRAQGRDPDAAARIRDDALALQEAGAFAIVLETIPGALAADITSSLRIPTIGIGAGPSCDGQVQVLHDLAGIPPGREFRHVRQYGHVGDALVEAVEKYAAEVRNGAFPAAEHTI